MARARHLLIFCILFSNALIAEVQLTPTPSTKSSKNCELLIRGTKAELDTKEQKTASAYFDLIHNYLIHKNAVSLAQLFHQRLNVSSIRIKSILINWDRLFGTPSIVKYRLYEITEDSEQAFSPTVTCPTPEIVATPMYGYKKQYLAIFQISGSRELGDLGVYFAENPTSDGYKILYWHNQQNTHIGKPIRDWVSLTSYFVNDKKELGAILSANTAKKLATPSGRYYFSEQAAIGKELESSLGEKPIDNYLEEQFPDLELSYADSLLSKTGAGLSIKLKLDKKTTKAKAKILCDETHKKVIQKIHESEISGFECGFTLPGENPELDSSLGSHYYQISNQTELFKKWDEAAHSKNK